MPPHASESPAKKQSKWSAEEDALIIELRGSNMKWEDISKRLPGRSAISCRLHYQNYLERRSEWDEERKNKLARLYERFKPEMWAKVAEEMAIPWRAAEAMHWHIGEQDMARRAGVTPFSLTAQNLDSHHQGGHGHHRGSPRGHGHGHGHSHSQGSAREMIGPGGRWARGGAPVPAPPPPPPPPPPPLSRSYTMRRESSTGSSGGGHHHAQHHHHHIPIAHHEPQQQQQQHVVTAIEGYPGAAPYATSQHHLQPHPYHHHQGGGPLAPIQTAPPPSQQQQQQQQQTNSRGPGMLLLPGVAELTTGVSPYSTLAYSVGGVMGSPAQAAAATSPGPYAPLPPPPPPPTAAATLGGFPPPPQPPPPPPPSHQTGGSTKRRRSSPGSASPEASRRRQHLLEPRPP